jgi:hypothetical protein
MGVSDEFSHGSLTYHLANRVSPLITSIRAGVVGKWIHYHPLNAWGSDTVPSINAHGVAWCANSLKKHPP